MSNSVLPMFSSRSFMVYGLAFRSLIHFEFIFIYDVRKIHSFTCNSLVFPAPFMEETPFFSFVYSCHLCCRLIDHRCVGLFLGSLFCSIDLYVSIYLSAYCFDFCSFYHDLKLGSVMRLALFFFFMIVLAIQCLQYFHTNFKITCSGSVKNAIGISVGIALNL